MSAVQKIVVRTSFSVLADPVAAALEVHEATADVVDRGEDVKIVSGKRLLVRL